MEGRWQLSTAEPHLPARCILPPTHSCIYPPPPQTRADGQPIRSDRDKRAIYDVVQGHLLGTSVAQQQLLAAASGGAGFGPPYTPAGASGYGAPGMLSGVSSALGVPTPGSSLHDPQQQSILRALSGKWKGRVP